MINLMLKHTWCVSAYLSIFSVLLIQSINGQNYHVKLKSIDPSQFNVINKIEVYTQNPHKSINYSLPSTLKKNDFRIKIYVINSIQYWYNNFNDDSNKVVWDDLYNYYKPDTCELSKKRITCFLSYIIGIKKNRRFIIFDSNSNFDFRDEKEYFLDSLTDKKNAIEICNISEYHKSKSIKYSIWVRLGYKKLPEKLSSIGAIDSLLLLNINSTYLGKLKYNFKNFYFLLSETFNQTNVWSNNSASAYITNSFKKLLLLNKNYIPIKFGDTINTNNLELDLSVDSRKKIIYNINFIKNVNKNYGVNVGGYIPNFSNTNELDKIDYNIKFESADYTILHFWGSWCVPCHKATPVIKDLFKQQFLENTRVQLLGVAFEKSSDFTSYEQLIKYENIYWPQVVELSTTKFSIIKKFKIKAYPTFIVIDNTGLIKFREEGLDGLDNLKKFLMAFKNNFKKNHPIY